ncbi:alpha/beta fold hydrolase [Oscillatoria sp. FACHB-1407]|uniref:alpha/beta fold hydrolase n=1 Tax=Oscillatoria sp. FACHB-1407 TaxID=2692847 RepID=UPI0016865D56|nr:alpha/beta fold hydrolase [Oscillatoria sp. FACHB-1407]MBD2465548.1 alpha/beta fold hydrolase [Oscillatoria sp. FACHB-1407]
MEQSIHFCLTPDHVNLAYAMTGQGYPLVKAANWLSHLEFDWQSPVWRHWWEELSKRFTVVRYDERGCGLSDWNVPNFSFDAWVQDLETVINTVKLERFALLGISQGAGVAIAYAVKHPEKVSHLILYGGYAQGRLKRNATREQVEEAEIRAKLVQLGWGRDNPAFRQLFTSLFIPEGTLEQLNAFNELQKISTSPDNAAKFIHLFNSTDVCDLATQVTVPTLVLHAQHEVEITFDQGRLLAALIPNAQFVPLDSKNHILLNHEPAWQRFLKEVQQFIQPDRVASLNPASIKPDETAVVFPTTDVQPDSMRLELTQVLTDREQEILELIAQGLSNTQISEQLVLSPKTVKNHITHIFSKMQVKTRAEAIVKARNAGFGTGMGLES